MESTAMAAPRGAIHRLGCPDAQVPRCITLVDQLPCVSKKRAKERNSATLRFPRSTVSLLIYGANGSALTLPIPVQSHWMDPRFKFAEINLCVEGISETSGYETARYTGKL